MKKILLPALIALSLSGCNSGTGGVTIESVQTALKSACGFELLAATAAQTVASLLGVPGITTAVDIANAVCAQVNTKVPGATAGETVVMVRGVPVQGHRLR